MDSQYKMEKELMVTGFNGTTALEAHLALDMIGLFAPVVQFLYVGFGLANYTHWLTFAMEFVTVTVLYLAALTILNAYLIELNILVVLSLVVSYMLMPYVVGTKTVGHKLGSGDHIDETIYPLALFRGGTFYLTLFCILAVDFEVFPRRFIKCEDYGYSPMDVGTGAYLLCTGAVAREAKFFNNKYEHMLGSILSRAKKTLTAVFPLMILGATRLVVIMSSNYQTHQTEYGLHWNFFFTLAAIQVLSFIIFSVFHPRMTMYLAVGTALLQEYILSGLGVKHFILDETTSRNTFLTANKEGIVSCLGYFSIHLIGITFGQIIFKSSYRRSYNSIHLLKKLLFVTLIMYSIFTMSSYIELASRRMVNLTYILWMAAMFSECTMNALTFEYVYTSRGLTRKIPDLYMAINNNGMVFFLMGNILTGLINTTINTQKQSDAISILILFVYMLILCGSVYVLDRLAKRGRISDIKPD